MNRIKRSLIKGAFNFNKSLKGIDTKPELPEYIGNGTLIPKAIFNVNYPYLNVIYDQIHICYDNSAYDACFVMIRKLIESLIIEIYEKKGLQSSIKNSDGNYFELKRLVNEFIRDNRFNLSRNAKKDLENIRDLANRSAHTRTFTATKTDIENIRNGIRGAVQELVTVFNS